MIDEILHFCVVVIVVIIIAVWAIRYPGEIAWIIHGIGAFISNASNWIGTFIYDLQTQKWKGTTS